MDPVKKEYTSKKALYLLLCGLLGLILFVTIQQAAMLTLLLLLVNQVGALDAGLQTQITMFDSISYILAIFFGAWYGIWLGLHWYAIVYEAGRRGLFHAFLGRLAGNNNVANTPEAKTPIMTRPQPAPKQAAPARPSQPRKASWEFEDLAKLRPVTPRPARMTTNEEGTWTKKVSVKPGAVKRSVKKAAPSATPAKPVVNQNSRRKVVSKTAIKQVL